jgi:cardiolipin synthase
VTATDQPSPSLLPSDERMQRLRRTLEGVVGIPATEGNRVDILRNGREIFPAMLEAIEQSQHTVDFLTFVYWEGSVGARFAEALAERARAGVRVRVLLDAFGARAIRKDLVKVMEEAGCQVAWFRPITKLKPSLVNHRTHRKVLVCDEQVSFTGGVGIADEWDGDALDETQWRDTHFRLEGPATDGLRAAFLDNWAETFDVLFDLAIDRFPEQPRPGSSVVQVVRGTSEVGPSDITNALDALLQLAEERLWLTTAYFVPDDRFLGRLCDAAARGVDVRILLPGPHADKRFVQMAGEASYEPLLASGVRLWCFQPSMLHAKLLTVDSLVSMVGSANFNNRSRSLDEEVDLVVFDPDVTVLLEQHFLDDLGRSRELHEERWAERNGIQKVMEATVTTVDGVL